MLKRNNLLNACTTGESDIFHELKKLRKVNDNVLTTIVGTKDNITGHFAVYERICNSNSNVTCNYDRMELILLRNTVEHDLIFWKCHPRRQKYFGWVVISH